MKKINLAIISAITGFGANLLFAQNVGINTKNPQGILHIDGKRDNPATGNTFSDSQKSNDFIVTNDGRIGLGNLDPKVKLDIRDANSADSDIGVGYTTQTAAVAGEGALRYDSVTKAMQYSDGIFWIQLEPYIEKAVVVATKTSSANRSWNRSVFTTNSSIPISVRAYLTDWQSKFDNTNSFNPSTGMFTAPVDGLYIVSYTTAINATVVRGYTPQYEMHYERYNAATTYSNMDASGTNTNPSLSILLEKSKCNNSFAASSGDVAINIGGNCTTSFNMKKGEKLVMPLYIALDAPSKTLISTGGYNNLTIVQQ